MINAGQLRTALAVFVAIALGSAHGAVSVTASKEYVDRKTTLHANTNGTGEVVGYYLGTQMDIGLQPQGDYAQPSDVPTNNNQLVNGAGYITGESSTNSFVKKTGDTMTGPLTIGLRSPIAPTNAGPRSLVVGDFNKASGTNAIAVGTWTIASGNDAHAEGNISQANGPGSHAEGNNTRADGAYSHAEGSDGKAIGLASHVEGSQTEAGMNAIAAHAEGVMTKVFAPGAHVEGLGLDVPNPYAPGTTNRLGTAAGFFSHVEGIVGTAQGFGSHVEGFNAHDGDATNASSFVWQGYRGIVPSNEVLAGYFAAPESAAAQQFFYYALTNTPAYVSKGQGTFCINPAPKTGSTDPASGFYIGERDLASRLADKASEAEAEALRQGKQDTLTFDSMPKSESANPVTSGGVHSALTSSTVVNRDMRNLKIAGLPASGTGYFVFRTSDNFDYRKAQWYSSKSMWMITIVGAGSFLGLRTTSDPKVYEAITIDMLDRVTHVANLDFDISDTLSFVYGGEAYTVFGVTDDRIAKISEVESLLFAQYYPEGNVKSAAEFTPDIKYNDPDTTERTITVKPFCNTGDSENDNSSLVGRVVIPPFVDAQGSPYISDDGTRYKVVGLSGVSSAPAGNSTKLTGIIAPNTVTNIGDNAFRRCNSLTSVSLPSVTAIGSRAFSGCSTLAPVPLPAVTTVGEFAFEYCQYALTSVSLPSATTIEFGAFYNCISLTSVSLPSATTIGYSAFSSCAQLTSISLPSATTIGQYAFVSCGKLASVDFGGTPRLSVPTLGAGAFNSVPAACKIIVPYTQYDAWTAASGWSALQQEFVRHAEKADKPATFTEGNLAKFDSKGNPTDSGKKPADFATAVQGAKAEDSVQRTLDNATPSAKTAVTVGVRSTEDAADRGQASLAVGDHPKASGKNAVATGTWTQATGQDAHAEGNLSQATNYGAHAEGDNTRATGAYSHAEGTDTEASGLVSHAEGNYTTAAGTGAHAEGMFAKASGVAAHAEGSNLDKLAALLQAAGADQRVVALFRSAATDAEGAFSHTEGLVSATSRMGSHAQGFRASDGGNQFSFVWQGYSGAVPTSEQMQALLNDPTSQDAQAALQCLVTALNARAAYASKGPGTFCINPVSQGGSTDPKSGFFIGDESLDKALRYSFHTATVSSGATPAVTNLADRAINTVTLGPSVTAAGVTLPTATAGYARDFYLDLTVNATNSPTLTFTDPATGAAANIAFGADSLAAVGPGANLVHFTELPGNRWLVDTRHEGSK